MKSFKKHFNSSNVLIILIFEEIYILNSVYNGRKLLE